MLERCSIRKGAEPGQKSTNGQHLAPIPGISGSGTRWVYQFTPLLADAARPLRHATGDPWFVDETDVKVAGRWWYLYRAVDQYGQVIDVLLSEQRDTAAARRFFVRALGYGPALVEVTTDKPSPYLKGAVASVEPRR